MKKNCISDSTLMISSALVLSTVTTSATASTSSPVAIVADKRFVSAAG